MGATPHQTQPIRWALVAATCVLTVSSGCSGCGRRDGCGVRQEWFATSLGLLRTTDNNSGEEEASPPPPKKPRICGDWGTVGGDWGMHEQPRVPHLKSGCSARGTLAIQSVFVHSVLPLLGVLAGLAWLNPPPPPPLGLKWAPNCST